MALVSQITVWEPFVEESTNSLLSSWLLDLGSKPPSPLCHVLDTALHSSLWLLSPQGAATEGGPRPSKLQITASTSPQPLHHAPEGHMMD